MLNDNIKRAIKAVNSVKDFDNPLHTPKKVYEEIKAAEADISDIN